MIDAERDDYDPFITVAANRQVVRLKNGFTGRLVYWARVGDYATVIIAGRHVRVRKDEIKCIVQ